MAITLYKLLDKYVGKITVDQEMIDNNNCINSLDSLNKTPTSIETIIILDTSGSMGDTANLICSKILPHVFDKLGYLPTDNIHLIEFNTNSVHRQLLVKDFATYRTYVTGCTQMRHAISNLEKVISQYNIKKFRLLAISDGILDDQMDTLSACEKLAKNINNLTVKSQSIRLFTSQSQPDTRGLAGVLQLNNVAESNLIDIYANFATNSNVQKIVDDVANLFKDDKMQNNLQLVSSTKNIRANGWTNISTFEYSLREGDNIIWFDNDILPDLTINGQKIIINESLVTMAISADNFDQIIGQHLDFYLNRIRVLKVINTVESKNELALASNFFTKLENLLESQRHVEFDIANLNGRIKYFSNLIQKRKKTIFTTIRQLINDDKISMLNNQQQADYLRSTDNTSLGKGLARRALKEGIDFTDDLRKEVRNIHANLHEIQEIDDTNHIVSFFCQDTTLGGIKVVAKLVEEDNLLDQMEATDILQLINIVGIAANSTVGDYPDPMCYRINHLFVGNYISVSDITLCGQNLYSIGDKEHPITNAIPIFEDARILNFLKTYAPTILQLSSSIGMRRMLANVPMTCGYTMAAGITKLVEMLNISKSTLVFDNFKLLVDNFDNISGKYFDNVNQFLTNANSNKNMFEPILNILGFCKDNNNAYNSFYIDNNGFTNMIKPIKYMVQTENENIDKVLRSIYSYEAAMAIRRILKKNNSSNDPSFVKKMMEKLLNIDYLNNGKKVTDLFESESDLNYCNTFSINTNYLDKLANVLNFDSIVLLPTFLKANSIDDIKDIQTVTINNIGDYLHTDEKFKFHTIVQSLLYPKKIDRIEDQYMKILDLVHSEKVEMMIKTYVENLYSDEYQIRLATKKIAEQQELMQEFVRQATLADTDTFVQLMMNGITYRGQQFAITNINSYGATELKYSLINSHRQPGEKICAFLQAIYRNKIVWNNGNTVRLAKDEYRQAVTKYNCVMEIYKKNSNHVYRGKPNRQGHSNEKPSYYAYGYDSLEEYFDSISYRDQEEYRRVHVGCCGL